MTSARTIWAIAPIAIVMTVACGGETASTPTPSASQAVSAGAVESPTPSPAGPTFKLAAAGAGVTASGTILVSPSASQVTVELRITGLQARSSHVSHIHIGSCEQRGGIAFALNQVVADGQGDADATTTLNEHYPPATGHWYVVVHAGPDMQGTNSNYLLCGNLF